MLTRGGENGHHVFEGERKSRATDQSPQDSRKKKPFLLFLSFTPTEIATKTGSDFSSIKLNKKCKRPLV